MNPIFSEAVRRALRRRREAQQKGLGSKATHDVSFLASGGQPKSGSSGLGRLKLLWVGLVGALMALFCLFTPIPILLLRAVDLSWLADYLWYGLFPALLIFIAIAIYAWWRS